MTVRTSPDMSAKRPRDGPEGPDGPDGPPAGGAGDGVGADAGASVPDSGAADSSARRMRARVDIDLSNDDDDDSSAPVPAPAPVPVPVPAPAPVPAPVPAFGAVGSSVSSSGGAASGGGSSGVATTVPTWRISSDEFEPVVRPVTPMTEPPAADVTDAQIYWNSELRARVFINNKSQPRPLVFISDAATGVMKGFESFPRSCYLEHKVSTAGRFVTVSEHKCVRVWELSPALDSATLVRYYNLSSRYGVYEVLTNEVSVSSDGYVAVPFKANGNDPVTRIAVFRVSDNTFIRLFTEPAPAPDRLHTQTTAMATGGRLYRVVQNLVRAYSCSDDIVEPRWEAMIRKHSCDANSLHASPCGNFVVATFGWGGFACWKWDDGSNVVKHNLGPATPTSTKVVWDLASEGAALYDLVRMPRPVSARTTPSKKAMSILPSGHEFAPPIFLRSSSSSSSSSVPPAAGGGGGGGGGSSECPICLDKPKNATFLCGHMGCFECLTGCVNTHKVCHICRRHVDSVVKLFLDG